MKEEMQIAELSGPQAVELVVATPTKAQRIVSLAERLIQGIEHGKEFPRKELGQILNMEPDGMRFQIVMAEVNQVLERSGYHLTTTGSNGTVWKVVNIDQSTKVVRDFNRKAMTLIKRSAIFAHSVVTNHGDKLTPGMKKKLEKQAEIQALRFALMTRKAM